MRLGIYGKKVGMTQIFDETGGTLPVTVIDASDCVITQVKTKATDGYNALQVGFGEKKPQNVRKAQTGHFKKANTAPKMRMAELRFDAETDLTQFQSGKTLTPTMFAKGDAVDVTGTSKGMGFTGVMKRYNWHGADATHGVSKYFRHGGSNGSNTFPGRVLKNKGAPGQKGNGPKTVLNLTVAGVIPEQNLILLKGAVPGSKNGWVEIRASKRMKAPEGRSFTA